MALIVESYPNGITVSSTPMYVTMGSFDITNDEQKLENRQHDPNERGKTALMDTRLPTYWYDGRKFILHIIVIVFSDLAVNPC
jgi:hypothetical protein